MDAAELLERVKTIVEKQEEKRKSDAFNFNIFSVTGIQAKELPFCSFLRELLDPKGSHMQGALFLETFTRQVLIQDNLSELDFTKANVLQELYIAKDRRIDILISVGNRIIPIEVKIYSGDQVTQLKDYYNYAKREDKNTTIYYLTLDGHEPSKKSRGSLKKGSQYRCISFTKDILTWLESMMSIEKVKMVPRLYESLTQFTDAIRELTNQRGEQTIMQCNELIKTPQDFHAAVELSEALVSVKIEKMNAVFSEIEKHLAISRPDFKVIDRGYLKKSFEYYNKRKNNYPNLTFLLPLKDHYPANKIIVLQVEITKEGYLYFGVCDWDESTKKNPIIDEENKDYVLANSNKDPEAVNCTNIFYWWDYLPEGMQEDVNYRNTNSEFELLFDSELFEEYINTVCDRIEAFMDEWNK